MCSSGAPKPAARAPEAPVPPPMSGTGTDADARRRRAASNSGTILTGAGGTMSSAPTMNKTLLGS